MEETEPIFDFEPLKRFLQRKGYTIGTRLAYEPFKPEDVKAADITNGTMTFSEDGIFVKGGDGREHQVFLYKKDYHLQRYGKPRYHICKCDTIEEFINSGGFRQHYVRANSEPVPVIDLDDYIDREKVIDGLSLCSYCRKIISSYGNISSTTFVEMLKAANNDNHEGEELELDLFGYVKEWDAISKAIREKHQYTCEKCGLKIEDDYDKQYMHVHHKNGDKLNNHESNLQCLCLYCHANVDEHHLKRLTSGANKYQYYTFVDRYADEGLWNLTDAGIQKIHQIAKEIYRGTGVVNIEIHNHFEGTIDTLNISG